MRRVMLVVVLLVAGLAQASEHVTFEQITVADTAIGITSTVTNPANRPAQNRCLLKLRTAQISYRYDGGTPTSTVGMVMDPGDVLELGSNEDARRFLAIRTGSTSGQLDVHCER